MATPQWIKDIGNSLRDNVLPVAANVLGGAAGGALYASLTKPAASASSQTVQQPAKPASSITKTEADLGLMSMKIAGVPVVIAGAIAVIAYLALRK